MLKAIREKLGISLLASFLFLAVLPLTLAGFLSLQQIQHQTKTEVLNRLESVSQVRQGEIDRWLDDNQFALQGALTDDNQTQRMVSILSFDRDWTLTIGTVNTYLVGELQKQEALKSYFIYNREGVVLMSTDPALQNTSIAEQVYFPDSLNQVNIHAPYFDTATGEFRMVITRPITDSNQNVVGILAGEVNLATLENILVTRSGLGETGETYLVSQNEKYLITPSRFDVPQYRSYNTEGINRALQGQNGSGEYLFDYRDVAVFGYYQWIPELRAGLITEIDVAEGLETVESVRNIVIVATFGAALVAFIVGLAITISITRPLSRLTHVANAVMKEDYSQRANLTIPNEIGQLGNAFDGMTTQLIENIQRLADLNAHLEERVKERTKELETATNQALEATRLKDEFLSVMSHELRTPLNAILGYQGLLKLMGNVDGKSLDMVQRTIVNAERLLSLINDILDISRIESGRFVLAPHSFDLEKLTNKLKLQMQVLAQQKELDFAIQLEPNVPKIIYADEDGITKILTNLLSNALKFTDTGSVVMRISNPENQLVIEVKDTGIGIPAHMQQVIFEKFRQVDSTVKRKHGGSGLGLSIVHQITQAMGGKITVQSELDKGTTFTVILPLQVQPSEEKL